MGRTERTYLRWRSRVRHYPLHGTWGGVFNDRAEPGMATRHTMVRRGTNISPPPQFTGYRQRRLPRPIQLQRGNRLGCYA